MNKQTDRDSVTKPAPAIAAFTVRAATLTELPACARFAADLVALHHLWDAKRYFLSDGICAGYLRFFSSEIAHPDVVLAVATLADEVVGYAYGRFEGRDWNSLLDEAGFVHDLYVADSARGAGIARALLAHAETALAARGAKRVVLYSATQNTSGRALFASSGYREGLVEYCKNVGER
jgi:ribosomal protein S18 acetylase RimI-like enzyme